METSMHPPVGDRLWNTRYGVMASTQEETPAARSLRLYGEWIEQELDLLSGFVLDGNSVLEIGGDLGGHTLWLSRAVGEKGQVHVIEPARIEFQRLCANLALNNLSNVFAQQAWVGRDIGQVSVSREAGAAAERTRGVTVDSLNLDALNLLKVNIPGSLVKLLQGAEDTLRRFRPMVYTRLGNGEHAVAEVAALKERGYRCWSHLPYQFNGENYAGQVDNVFPGCIHQNVVATPIESRTEFERLREL